MSERCEECACQLTDFGHGVGWRCQLCDCRDQLKDVLADLRALIREKDAALNKRLAEKAERLEASWPDETKVGVTFTAGECRRAKAALERKEADDATRT